MYEKLINSLKNAPEIQSLSPGRRYLLLQAANAIETLTEQLAKDSSASNPGLDATEVCRMAIQHYGKEDQARKCVEELAELQIALCRYPIGRSTRVNIAEEIADVRIMLQQMEIIFGVGAAVEEFNHQKLARLKSRIESEGRTNGDL